MANPRAGDGLEIVSVGAVYSGPLYKKYWSCSRGKDRYPYPVGYRALRTFDGLSYTMEIHQGLKGPIFLVSSEDGTSCSGQTPDMAWQQFTKRGGAARRVSNSCRKRCPSSSSIDGVELFGFRNPFVQRLLRELVANGSGLPELTLCSPSLADGPSNLCPEDADDSVTGKAEPNRTFRDLHSLVEERWCSRNRSRKQLAVTSTHRSESNRLLHQKSLQIAEFSTSGKPDGALRPILSNRRECPLDMSRTCSEDAAEIVDKDMDLDPHIGLVSGGSRASENGISYSTTCLDSKMLSITSNAHELVQNSTCELTQSRAAGLHTTKDSTALHYEVLCDMRTCSVGTPKQFFSSDHTISAGREDQSKLRSCVEMVSGMHENTLDRSLDASSIGGKALGVNDTDKNIEFISVKFCADVELFIPDTLEDTQVNLKESPIKNENELFHKKNAHELRVKADTHHRLPFVEQLISTDRTCSPSQMWCQAVVQGEGSGNPVENEFDEVEIEQSQSRVAISSGSSYACSEGTDLEQSQPGMGELARSMMTFLLPRALPLLKKTYHRRRTRKQARSTKGGLSVHSLKDVKSDSQNEDGCRGTSALAQDVCTIDSGGEILKEKMVPKEVSECYTYRNNPLSMDPEDLVGEKSIIPDSFDDDLLDTGTDCPMHIGISETDDCGKSSMLKDISWRKVDKKIKGCPSIIDACEKIDPCKAEVTEKESFVCSSGCMADSKDKIVQKVSTGQFPPPIYRSAIYSDNVCNVQQETVQKDDSIDHGFYTIDGKYDVISESKGNTLIEETCFAPLASENNVGNGSVTDVCLSKVGNKINCQFERNREPDGHLIHSKSDNSPNGNEIFLPLVTSGIPPDTEMKGFELALHVEKAFPSNKHEHLHDRDLDSVNPNITKSLKCFRNHECIDHKCLPLHSDQGLPIDDTSNCNFKDLACEFVTQTDISISADIRTGSQCHLKPLCCFIHPDPILSIFLTTKRNELHLCVITGILECNNRNIFIYKISADKGCSNPPGFYGHTLMYVPVQWWCLEEKISLERSCIQIGAEEGSLVLHNSIKVPICRERNMDCLCSLCKSDSVEENGVKIVHVNNGYVSIIKKLITNRRVICILACAPRHLIAAEESGILHVWTMISDWSDTSEEYNLPSLTYGSRLIVELKRLRNCSLIIGRNGVGEFALWDFSKKVLLARFASPNYLFSQFFPLPVDFCSNNREEAPKFFGNYDTHGKDATGTTNSQLPNHGEESLTHHSLQKDVVWLLVCAYSDIESSAKVNASNVNSVGCWRLAMLTDNRIFCGDVLDSSASSVCVSLGEGILGTIDGVLYTWEISSGKKMVELQPFNGGSISSLAADPDSGALAVASNHCEVLVYARSHDIY